jgi:hypothetical protein
MTRSPRAHRIGELAWHVVQSTVGAGEAAGYEVTAHLADAAMSAGP